MKEHKSNEYSTKDLAEAGFLLTKSAVLIRVEKENRTCWFVFRDKEKCTKLSGNFWFGNAPVPARLFYDSIQTLKNRIFTYQN